MLVAGFLFSAVAAYMAGLVGSSNNPISGVTIATILCAALALSALGLEAPEGPVAAIVIGAAVCCAAAIAGDNMQDLKAGYLLGATPWKQQVLQAVGTVTAAFVLAPILTLLLKAYGFGAPTAEHPEPLAAPQATLMKSVAEGVFGAGLQWDMIGIGAALAALVIAADVFQERRGSSFRLPVLAVAVGIYLPFELSVAILFGGLVAWAFGRRARGATSEHREEGVRGGVLFASGLITGEALLGILLAIPIVSTGERRPLAIAGEELGPWPGVALLVAVLVLLYRSALKFMRRAER